MTVRKNFLFDDDVARHLEEIAREEGKTQKQIAQEAIEQRYETIKQMKRMKAFKALVGSVPEGSLKDVNIKDIRAERAIHRAK